jgi:hypothetical protein
MVVSFMQKLLVELINNRDSFWLWFVCLWVSWVLCGVWLGQETHATLERVLERTWVQFPHKLLVLQKNYVLGGQVFDWKI